MKFSESKDGQKRVTIRVEHRVDRDQIIHALAHGGVPDVKASARVLRDEVATSLWLHGQSMFEDDPDEDDLASAEEFVTAALGEEA